MRITESRLRSIIRQLVKESRVFLNESATTTEILNGAFKNVKARSGGRDYDVAAEDFKNEVSDMIKNIEDMKARMPAKFPGISETDKSAIEDLLGRIPDGTRFGPRDLHFAVQQVNDDTPAPPKSAPIDMSSLPDPSQVDVKGELTRLAEKMPEVFGPASESDPTVASISAGIRPEDAKFFSHGMSVKSENVSTGADPSDRRKVFPRDKSGNVLRRPDGSIIFFYVNPRLTTTVYAIYDVYTNSFVSEQVFERRNIIYRNMWQQRKLPGPIAMQQSRLVRPRRF
jgi:hypothetical protein